MTIRTENVFLLYFRFGDDDASGTNHNKLCKKVETFFCRKISDSAILVFSNQSFEKTADSLFEGLDSGCNARLIPLSNTSAIP